MRKFADMIEAEPDGDEDLSSDTSDFEEFDHIGTGSLDEHKGPGDGDTGADGGTGIGVQWPSTWRIDFFP